MAKQHRKNLTKDNYSLEYEGNLSLTARAGLWVVTFIVVPSMNGHRAPAQGTTHSQGMGKASLWAQLV